MPYLGIFGLEFQETIVIFEISIVEFVKNKSLIHTINFSVGSAFSKGPESAFLEGPGPGPGTGPLYKVCHAHDAFLINYDKTLSSLLNL